MINLLLERIGIASPHCGKNEVKDYFILTITNVSTNDLVLDNWLTITLTDSNNNQAICAADDLCNDSTPPPGLAFEKDSSPGLDICYVQARGPLEKNTSRTIGVKIIRAGLLDEIGNRIQYGDPFHVASFGNLKVRELSVKYTLAFPVDTSTEFQCFQVKAHNARTATGRTATWELAPRQGEWQKVRAELAGGAVPIAAALDSCLCMLLICKAESAANPLADIDKQLQEVSDKLASEAAGWDGLSFVRAQQAIAEILRVSRPERGRSFDEAINELYKVYGHCLQLRPKNNAAKEVVIAQDSLARSIMELKNKHVISMPMPDRFHESLQILLMFCQSLRKSPFDWAKDYSEKAFQSRLHQFLCDTQNSVEREVATGPGRVDFLLINTPVELKAIPLKDDPGKIAGQHSQQAADYASIRGYGIGILLVLDTQNRSAENAHRPHLSEECIVKPILSMVGVGGTSTTLVVTITVGAFPPISSALKTPLKSAKGKK